MEMTVAEYKGIVVRALRVLDEELRAPFQVCTEDGVALTDAGRDRRLTAAIGVAEFAGMGSIPVEEYLSPE